MKLAHFDLFKDDADYALNEYPTDNSADPETMNFASPSPYSNPQPTYRNPQAFVNPYANVPLSPQQQKHVLGGVYGAQLQGGVYGQYQGYPQAMPSYGYGVQSQSPIGMIRKLF